VFRLMAHPRFRAAYDFLLLRAGESEEVREAGEWWTQAQALSADELSASLAPKTPVRSGEPAAAPKRRRRRRGGRGRKAGTPEAGPQD
jgi:poly(A) polymerase